MMTAPDGGRRFELEQEFDRWARAMDMVLERAPGVTRSNWLAGRSLGALDLDEIEGLCRVAQKQYRRLVDRLQADGRMARAPRH